MMGQDYSRWTDGQLAAAARSPMPGLEQQMLLAEIGRRMRDRRQSAGPTSDVLADFQRGQTDATRPGMPPQGSQPISAGTNPIVTGAQEIARQQQMQNAQPPQAAPVKAAMGGRGGDLAETALLEGRYPAGHEGMRRGGGGGSGFERYLARAMGLYGDEVPLGAEYDTPEEAKTYQAQFAGEDYTAPILARIADERGVVDREYKTDKWLAFANAGINAMGGGPSFWGNVSRGAQQGLAALNQAREKRRQSRRDLSAQETSAQTARGQRSDRQMAAAQALMMQGLGAQEARRAGVRDAALKLYGEDRADNRTAMAQGRYDLENKYESLLRIGLSPEEARTVVAASVGGAQANTERAAIASLGQMIKAWDANSAARDRDARNGVMYEAFVAAGRTPPPEAMPPGSEAGIAAPPARRTTAPARQAPASAPYTGAIDMSGGEGRGQQPLPNGWAYTK